MNTRSRQSDSMLVQLRVRICAAAHWD